MRVSRKASVVKKAVRICKLLVAPIIKWVLNDNLCLLYAIWEMCTVAQKNILTVSQCHLFATMLNYPGHIFWLSKTSLLEMNGKLCFVESFKYTMKISGSQRITKGILSLNVNNYLRWLSTTYENSGMRMKFIWRKVLKVDTNTKRPFTVASVYKLLSGAAGQCVSFRKAKWNNCGSLRVCYPIQPIRCCFHLSTFVFTATTISH